MGRSTSYDSLISSIAMPVGYVVAGPAAALIGVRPTLIIAALMIAVPSLLVLAAPAIRHVHRTAEGTILEASPA